MSAYVWGGNFWRWLENISHRSRLAKAAENATGHILYFFIANRLLQTLSKRLQAWRGEPFLFSVVIWLDLITNVSTASG
jgi:hypothetical protein